MNIIGHGIDIVEISHIKKIIERSGDHFERRCFTATERIITESDANRIQYLAGRFAAVVLRQKKRCLKLLVRDGARELRSSI